MCPTNFDGVKSKPNKTKKTTTTKELMKWIKAKKCNHSMSVGIFAFLPESSSLFKML